MQCQYSRSRARSLFEMGARVEKFANDVINANPVVARPLVVLVARFLGPGPLRLRMVKLAHELDDRQVLREAA